MIGILEGFFGPSWSIAQRLALADFLKQHGGDFYIYAPKADPFLRKRWQQLYPQEQHRELAELSLRFRALGIKFGLGFSPFELHNDLSPANKSRVIDKLTELNDIGIDLLGVFLDDMKGGADLASRQLEMVDLIQRHTQAKLLFCPTYYSFDPILDKVFGTRPPRYLEEISQMSAEVEIMWTGPKVLSDEISQEHLQEVTSLLGRKPFIWDNLYANDGPKNCKLLKLFAPEKREAAAREYAAGWALNPMNQAALARINFLTYLYFFREDPSPFFTAVRQCCPPKLAEVVLENAGAFSTQGLDQLNNEKKQQLIADLGDFNHPVAKDIVDWLTGRFIVGNECLTD